MSSVVMKLGSQNSYIGYRETLPKPDAEAPPFWSFGPHLYPLAYFICVAITVPTNLILYSVNNRIDEWPEKCVEINAAEASDCDPEASLIYPTISRTACWDPEYYIFLVGMTIAGLFNVGTAYHVHRGAWGRASYLDGLNRVMPRAFCMPCCTQPACRPRLAGMLYASEVASYISSASLILTAIFSMTINNSLHNIFALMFFATYLAYLLLFTLVQHNIKNKSLANFPSPLRYVAKVVIIGLGMMVFVIMVGIFAGLYSDNCWVLNTSDFRKKGLGLMQYIASFLCGCFTLTHIEDIRQEHTSKVYVEHSSSGKKDPPSHTVTNPAAGFDDAAGTGAGASTTDSARSKVGLKFANVAKISVLLHQTVAKPAPHELPRRLHGRKIVQTKPSHFRGLASDGISGVPGYKLKPGIPSCKVYTKALLKDRHAIEGAVIPADGEVKCLSSNDMDFIRIEWANERGYAWVPADKFTRMENRLTGAADAGY